MFSHLPKTELHCHVDGIVSPDILRAIQAGGYPIPVSPEVLQSAYPIRNQPEFWRYFELADPCEDDFELMKRILAIHVECLKAQNVAYAEIMLGSSELPRDPDRLVEDFRAFREWVTGLEDGQIQIEFLVAFGRNRPLERLDQIADRLIPLHQAGLLVGVALAGPELGYPVRPLARVFAKLREAGLGIEIHAGEWAGPESVWDALEFGSPNRIGHGVAIFQDSKLIDRVGRDQIHIEMCPTSNLKTGSVNRIEDHPIRRAKELGLNFSLNTDDPGPFECSLDSEYQLLADTFGFTESDFERIAGNALKSRFQPALRYIH